MSAEALASVLAIGVALAMLFAGAAVTLTAANIVKRLAGAFIAIIGSMLCLGALGAAGIVTAAAIAFAYCALGATLLVRAQELYGETETPGLNKADGGDEPREPRE